MKLNIHSKENPQINEYFYQGNEIVIKSNLTLFSITTPLLLILFPIGCISILFFLFIHISLAILSFFFGFLLISILYLHVKPHIGTNYHISGDAITFVHSKGEAKTISRSSIIKVLWYRSGLRIFYRSKSRIKSLVVHCSPASTLVARSFFDKE